MRTLVIFGKSSYKDIGKNHILLINLILILRAGLNEYKKRLR